MKKTILVSVASFISLCSWLTTPAMGEQNVQKVSGAKEHCLTCHADLPDQKLKAPTVVSAKDVHIKAGLTCTSCHGGDANNESARVAHSDTPEKKFAAIKTKEDVIAVCGSCHQQPLENFLKGAHNLSKKLPRQPNCVTCHGSHGIQIPSAALIAEPLCSSCHDVSQPRRIYRAIFEAEKELDETEVLINAAKGKIENSAQLDEQLKQTRSKLHGLSHTLNLFEITRNASAASDFAESVKAKLAPKLAGIKWGQVTKVVGIIILILLLGTGAFIGIRYGWQHRSNIPIPHGKKLTILLVAGGAGALIAAIVGWKGYHYIEHEPKFCTSCHTMNSAFKLWDESGHRKIECHTCHVANVVSNLHQLWLYTTRKPDEVVKHAEIDRAVCMQCHTSGSNKTKWDRIIETPGHQIHTIKNHIECVQCHATSVHRFKPDKNLCQSCHQQITLNAAGSMAEMHCDQCHPFLDKDAKRSLRPDRAACLECHETMQIKKEIFPADAPMKWACGECHKPHSAIRISNQDCKNCHDVKKGIHSVKAHKDCQQCHKPHAWKITNRAICESCHGNRAEHNPGSQCGKCHNAKGLYP
ncbi:MAG: hypothetical protein A2X86_16760 [Bdellovibrionales bacterium GWA2_49_15]|nr:MAG: hypothetical protein A2X86_16760 [Bdellovibrionales bacterium GWA2_49_15]HAZ12474.1 hypothetical protein [Bdellovibrionales bacterium]